MYQKRVVSFLSPYKIDRENTVTLLIFKKIRVDFDFLKNANAIYIVKGCPPSIPKTQTCYSIQIKTCS